jgi:hypothetical protein
MCRIAFSMLSSTVLEIHFLATFGLQGKSHTTLMRHAASSLKSPSVMVQSAAKAPVRL